MSLVWQRWLLWLRKAAAWRESFGTAWVEPANGFTFAALAGPIELPPLPWYGPEDFEDVVPGVSKAPARAAETPALGRPAAAEPGAAASAA